MALCDISHPRKSCKCESATDRDLICTLIRSKQEHRCMEVNHYETAALSIARMTLRMPTFKLPTPFVPVIHDIQPVMPVIPALTINHQRITGSLPSIPPTQEEVNSSLITNPLPFSKPPPSIKPPDIPVPNHLQNGDVDFQLNTNDPSPSKLPSINPSGKFEIGQIKNIISQLITNHHSKIKFPPFLKHLVSKHLQNEEINSTKSPGAKWGDQLPFFYRKWKSFKNFRW